MNEHWYASNNQSPSPGRLRGWCSSSDRGSHNTTSATCRFSPFWLTCKSIYIEKCVDFASFYLSFIALLSHNNKACRQQNDACFESSQLLSNMAIKCRIRWSWSMGEVLFIFVLQLLVLCVCVSALDMLLDRVALRYLPSKCCEV